jgi:hypothetical protein
MFRPVSLLYGYNLLVVFVPMNQPNWKWRRKKNAPLYAPLPPNRVVMLHEPFSWLLSKFSRHHLLIQDWDVTTWTLAISNDPSNFGWAYQFCLRYTLSIFWHKCVKGYEHRMMLALEEMEAQAETNLRQSLSVVGLLHEMDSFYDTIWWQAAQIHYVDMSLNLNVMGLWHTSSRPWISYDVLVCLARKTFKNALSKLPWIDCTKLV